MTRVGLLVPSVNTVVEPEFWRMAPPGVSFHAARMRNARSDVEDSIRMLDHVERAADELGSARVHAVAFACTASSFVHGPEGETALTAKIERLSGAPAVTTSGAVAAALHAVGATRVAMYTPYPEELNAREVAFFGTRALTVVQERGLGITEAFAIAEVSAAEVLALVASAPPPKDTDTIFLSCTNLATLEVIDRLERAYGLPVVSSNTATFWAVMRRAGLAAGPAAPGRLFQVAATGRA